MSKTIVITGAGSGVGRATTLKFAAEGWNVALLGRRKELMEETIRLAPPRAGKLAAYALDLCDPASLQPVFAQIHEAMGPVEALVNAAGTNTPSRSLQELSLENYHQIVETNLTGSYLCAQAVLPEMRAQGRGTIINVVSDAARQASAKAGPAYVVSKFGQLGLTQAINAEERPHGIRACAILPGDINTPLLDKRPVVPGAEARQKMLQPEDIAECIWLAVTLPGRAVIEELLIRPG